MTGNYRERFAGVTRRSFIKWIGAGAGAFDFGVPLRLLASCQPW